MITQNSYEQYDNDQRDEQTISQQSKVIKYLCDRNMQAFGPYLKGELIKMQQEQISQKQKTVIERMVFEDGRYVDYRESNYQDSRQFELLNKTIILVSGVPGGIKYYAKVEQGLGQGFCRTINLYIPGFDKKEERRGPYQGRYDDIAQLINDFMISLKIEKSVFIVHSYGGLIVKNFAYYYPHKVEALIQIASISLTKWQGQQEFEKIEQKMYKIDYSQLSFEKLQDEDYRNDLKELIDETKKSFKSYTKDQLAKLGPITIFDFYDVICMLKIRQSVPGGQSEIFYRMRQVSKNIPRMIVYSQNDVVVKAHTIEEEIYEFVVGEKAVQRRIIQQASSQPQLDLSNFNCNYIFRFDDASHYVQSEKGNEIGILAKHFIRQLDSTEIIHKQPKI